MTRKTIEQMDRDRENDVWVLVAELEKAKACIEHYKNECMKLTDLRNFIQKASSITV